MAKEQFISINRKRLEEHLAQYCRYFHRIGDASLCDKHSSDMCGVGHIDKIIFDCPYDCPHYYDGKFHPCVFGKCTYVKKVIKNISEADCSAEQCSDIKM